MENTIQVLESRLSSAIELKATGSILCAPLIQHYAARFAGIPLHEFLFDYEKAFEIFRKMKDHYPGYHIRRYSYASFHGPIIQKIGIMKCSFPGIELPDDYEVQFTESEVMHQSDYKILLTKGFEAFQLEFFKRVHGSGKEEVLHARAERTRLINIEKTEAKNCGQLLLYGNSAVTPDEMLSYSRSLKEFVRDLYKKPDLMDEVLSIIAEYCQNKYSPHGAQVDIPRILVAASRMNGEFFSLKLFERFFWKHTKKIILALEDAGITPFLHLDGNWSQNLPYFLEMPKKKMVIELDGNTDIYHAKRILEGHSCILGDVPSTMFVVETPEEVFNYCKSIIRDIGYDGGFILSSGCSLPYWAEHANVDAFFKAVLQ